MIRRHAAALLATVSAVTITAAAKATWIGAYADVGRPRLLGPGFVVRAGLEMAGYPYRPRIATIGYTEQAYDLTWWPGLARFTVVAMGGAAVAAVLLYAIVLLVSAAVRRKQTTDLATQAALAASSLLIALEPAAAAFWELRLRDTNVRWDLDAAVAVAVVMTLVGALSLFAIGRWWLGNDGRRRASGLVLSASAALVATFSGGIWASAALLAPEPPSGGPSAVVLVSIDTLRADHLGAYGYKRDTSPNLDRFAAEGVRFADVSSTSSWTLPSHMTMLTGLPSAAHRVTGGQKSNALRPYDTLPSQALTIAEVYRKAGYRTAAYVIDGFMYAEFGHAQGFEHYDDYSGTANCNVKYNMCVTTPSVLRSVSAFLQRWDQDGRKRPIFLFVHLFDVHSAYVPVPPFDTMFDPHAGAEALDYTQSKAVFHKTRTLSDDALRHYTALYDGEIRQIDAHMETLFGMFAQRGLFDDTLFAVVSDHGDEFLEHGNLEHANNIHQGVLHVPLLLRYPGVVPAGRVVQTPVSLMDVAPALLELSKVPAPAEFALGGRMGERFPRPPLVGLIEAEAEPGPVGAELHGRWYSMRLGDWKLIRDSENPGAEQLYNLAADPGETRDVSVENPERVNALSELLAQWHLEWGAGFSTVERGRARIGAAEEERLRALGYLQ